jgi:GTP-binding protein
MTDFYTSRTVALVGQPNVGKSCLFNRLARKRIAIVHDQAGVTRDVNAIEVDGDYMLLDTGGIGLQVEMTQRQLVEAAEEQVFIAAQASALIGFVVDGRLGCTPLDEMIATQLRAMNRPVVLIINKIDLPDQEDNAADFACLGFSQMVCVSAEHDRGIPELRALIDKKLGPKPELSAVEPEGRRIKICFIGRPNVGKSSLCNGLLKQKRLVVSEVSGTTRDSVTLNLDYTPPKSEEPWHFALVDTAGMKKTSKMGSSVEFFSSLRAKGAVERSDVVFLVIDALEGVTKQDKTILGEVVALGKPCAVIVNKWDLARDSFKDQEDGGVHGYKNEKEFREKYAEAALETLFFLPGSPVLFVSALSGYQLHDILKCAHEMDRRAGQTLSTPQINRLIQRLVDQQAPRFLQGKQFKVYYAVQTGNRPFKIRMFCNRETKLEDSYKRYLLKGFQTTFDLDGCPVLFQLVGKEVRYGEKRK